MPRNGLTRPVSHRCAGEWRSRSTPWLFFRLLMSGARFRFWYRMPGIYFGAAKSLHDSIVRALGAVNSPRPAVLECSLGFPTTRNEEHQGGVVVFCSERHQVHPFLFAQLLSVRASRVWRLAREQTTLFFSMYEACVRHVPGTIKMRHSQGRAMCGDTGRSSVACLALFPFVRPVGLVPGEIKSPRATFNNSRRRGRPIDLNTCCFRRTRSTPVELVQRA